MGASQVAQWLRESICQCMRCSCNSSVRRSLGVGTGNLPTTYYIILPSVRNKPDRRNPTSNNLYIVAAAAAKSLYLCLTLCDPIDSSPAGSSVPGILQARVLEWVAISFSNTCMHDKSLQLCPTLCNPMDSSPPGSSVHGTLQARILE